MAGYAAAHEWDEFLQYANGRDGAQVEELQH